MLGPDDSDADQDEADDRSDPEPMEHGDDDPRGAEDHQRVRQRVAGCEFGRHQRAWSMRARRLAPRTEP